MSRYRNIEIKKNRNPRPKGRRPIGPSASFRNLNPKRSRDLYNSLRPSANGRLKRPEASGPAGPASSPGLKARDIRLRNYNQSGFSIVEIIITTFVFSIISIIVTMNFVDTLDLQRRGSAAQKIQEQILFAIESMAKEIRVSQIQSPNDTGCNLTNLNISHPANGSIIYSVSNGVINKTVGGNTFSITSSKVNFSRLNFCVKGSGIDNEQPRVTIIASVITAGGQDSLQFDMQTTVSSRDMREELLN